MITIKKALAGVAVALGLVALAFSSIVPVAHVSEPPAVTPKPSHPNSEVSVLKLLNIYRSAHQLSPVTISNRTCEFANIRAREAEKEWSHAKFIERGQNMKELGEWSENLAQDYYTASEVMEAWKESPKHNKILLGSMVYACIERYHDTWALIGYEPPK
ncbi:MAG: CAP domain-containing protein [Candidatus Andersenbacteria bacterium]